MTMRGYVLTYTADVEGDWTTEPVETFLYPTQVAAWAAWDRAYRGPDMYGAEARPEVHKVSVDRDDIPGLVYVPGVGYVHIQWAAHQICVAADLMLTRGVAREDAIEVARRIAWYDWK